MSLLSKIQALQAHCAQEPGYFKVLEELLDVLAMFREGDASDLAFVLSGEWQPGTCHCGSCEKTTSTVRRMLAMCAKMEEP